MSAKEFDITKIKAVDQVEDSAKVNRLLQEGWILLKVTEHQWRDDEGALRASVVYTIGTEGDPQPY